VARQSPATIARWVIDAGWGGLDRITATAVAVSTGGDPAGPGGLFGLSGGSADGAVQAKDAHSAVVASGWDVLPAHRTGRYIVYIPIATAAVQAIGASNIVSTIPNPVEGAKQAADAASQLADTLTAPVRTLAYLGTAEAQERIAKFLIGAALVVVGGIIFARRFTKSVIDKVTGPIDNIAADVVAFKLSQGGGGARPAAAAAAPRPAPAAPAAAPRSTPPWFRPGREDPAEAKTTELSDVVKRTRHMLGREEAIASGTAPARGRAKRVPAKLVNPGGTPVTEGKAK